MDFKKGIAQAIAEAAGAEEVAVYAALEVPPRSDMGDYAFPCFPLAKAMKKAPPTIAAELAEKISLPETVAKAVPTGPYLNFFVDPALRAREVLGQVMERGSRYGSSDEGDGRVICIDYSSINIAKPFHIGHLSSTAIGHALVNIYSFLGYKTVGINHLGDWGTQFGKLIVAFEKWGDKATIEVGGVRELLKIYVRFHEEAEQDDTLNEAARAAFKRIEDGDPDALSYFEWFKEVTLKEVGHIYEMLDIQFDSYAGESFYNDKMDRVIRELREKNLLVKDEGASIVEFPEEDKMPPALILRADGASLYVTRDIAAAIYRKEHYDFYKSLYVVAYQQNLHFKQLFKVVDMMGYEWAKDMEHVAFGMVSMEDGTLSTRSGRVIFLDEVFDRAIERSRSLIDEKSPDLPNKDEVAKQVGIGALVYSTLSAGRIKDITFSWDRALNFDGETGPYCQYNHARCCTVLRKAAAGKGIEPLPPIDELLALLLDKTPRGDTNFSTLSDGPAQELIVQIANFPDAVTRAAEENEPSLVTRATTLVAQAFNRFYNEDRILDAEPATKDARLLLTDAARQVIKIGLNLIGVAAPEQM